MNDEKVSIQDEISIFFKGLDYPIEGSTKLLYKLSSKTFIPISFNFINNS